MIMVLTIYFLQILDLHPSTMKMKTNLRISPPSIPSPSLIFLQKLGWDDTDRPLSLLTWKLCNESNLILLITTCIFDNYSLPPAGLFLQIPAVVT